MDRPPVAVKVADTKPVEGSVSMSAQPSAARLAVICRRRLMGEGGLFFGEKSERLL